MTNVDTPSVSPERQPARPDDYRSMENPLNGPTLQQQKIETRHTLASRD